MQTLMFSSLLLWLAVFALLITVLALARQIGVLFERVAPMGALILDSGPKVGEQAPSFKLASLDGSAVSIGMAGTRGTLLFFLSPTCPVCKKLLPIIKSISKAEGKWLDVVLASDGEFFEHNEFWIRADLRAFPYVLSNELGMRYHVSKLPYAVLIDEQGIVRGKGLVNSREQLESLFLAREMNVASVQEFLHQPSAAIEL